MQHVSVTCPEEKYEEGNLFEAINISIPKIEGIGKIFHEANTRGLEEEAMHWYIVHNLHLPHIIFYEAQREPDFYHAIREALQTAGLAAVLQTGCITVASCIA